MEFIPHDYQEYAIRFIEDHPVSALLLDMGLGKTTITLSALQSLLFDSFQAHRILVIAPLRVAHSTWPAEIQKWDHLRELQYSVIKGTPKQRLEALNRKADIYIINRENIPWLCLQPFSFDTVVIDELSSFKNHQAKRYRSLMKQRNKIHRMIGLTGTPSTNGLQDLWAEFRLLDQGERLGRFIGQFREAYLQPDRRNGMTIYSYKPQPGAEDEIFKKISDITISMKALDHLKMPELMMIQHEVEMSADEMKTYKRLKNDLVLELDGSEITAANAASLSSELCQMASGAIYTEDKSWISIHDRKLDVLEDLIESSSGSPILIAYWFKHDLERIQKRFKVRELETEKDIQDWNERKIPVAIIHPAAAGHGLNLQSGGSTLIWFSLTWSLELYQQTNARLYRQGQKETVRIYHLVCKETLDEEILKSLEKKDASQQRLINAVKAEVRR